jgi:L-threonylcarbamoyladenylate synthase
MSKDPAIVPISLTEPDPSTLHAIVETLARGGLVGLPTDTLYGITARLDFPEALSRLRVIKGLPAASPLLFLVNSAEMAEDYWQSPIPERLKRLLAAFWPGPLTVIYHTTLHNPSAVHEGTLALRMPASPLLLALVGECGVPLASTSANSHGNPPASCPREAMDIFPREVDLWADGGVLLRGEPSTVFDAVHGEIIRFGRVAADDIWQVWREGER